MGASSSKSGIGHSVMNQMNTIVQVRNIHLLAYVGYLVIEFKLEFKSNLHKYNSTFVC